MQLPMSAKFTPNLMWRDRAGSTNLELIELAKQESLPDFTVLVTADQTAGRGRSGRTWQAPAGTSLAISVLLRPRLEQQDDLGKLGWLPLLGGLAMSENVAGLLPGPADNAPVVGVKWPNDVLVNERKICGVLTEMVPLNPAEGRFGPGVAVVIGAGINVSLTGDQLPVPTATSLTLDGANLPADLSERLDLVLSGYLQRLANWYGKFTESRLSATASGLRNAVLENCVSLNREVRAILPGGVEQVGRAVTIDDSGRLVLEVNGQLLPVAAGDIVHLRHS